uniref:DUF4939 domain-containing protein n=1 Tax=Amphilophus citrinellus TaxID=61819 RepID=A0A3Q0RF32_AMPCI
KFIRRKKHDRNKAWPHQRPLPTPEVFAGKLEKCGYFLTQCFLVFQQQNKTFVSDSSKIGFMVNLLRGRALSWGQAVMRQRPNFFTVHSGLGWQDPPCPLHFQRKGHRYSQQ